VRDLDVGQTREAVLAENRRMSKKNPVKAADLDEIVVLIEDAADLTAKELEQECNAKLEELNKRSWMTLSARQMADRIPISIFAMGDLVAG
jgi:hypothetical protein